MRRLAILLILLFMVACSSPTEEQLIQEEQDKVTEGFEDFMKEKQQQDQELEEQKGEETQIRPETVEKPKTKLDVQLPVDLETKYGSELTGCFEGYGDIEKIAAVASFCVTELATKYKDQDVCEQILVGEEKDKCYQSLAKEIQDSTVCNKISNEAIAMSCKEVIA